jgi:hypothetical protein
MGQAVVPMTDIRITTAGLDQLAAKFKGAEEIIGRELVTMVDRLTIAGSTESKRRVGVRTGTLRRSLTHEPARRAGGTVVGAFGTNVPYAKWHNDGRDAIEAKGKALRFTIGGVVYFRKRVGPAAGKKYMEAGAAVIRQRMPAEAAAAARRIRAELT